MLWLGELPRDIATTVGPWCCASAVGAKLKLLAKNFGRKKVNCSASFAAEQVATRLAASATTHVQGRRPVELRRLRIRGQ